MRILYPFVLGSFLLGLATACCSSDSSNAPEEQAQPVGGVVQEQPAQPGNPSAPAQQVAQGLQQMARGFQQLATAPENASVKPVHFRELKKLLTPLSGWTLSDTSGQMMNMPVPFSQAEGTYSNGDSRIKVSITDSAMNQVLVAPVTMMMAAGFERETDTGYERSTTVGGNPTWEKWRGDSKSGELTMLVQKRYLVKLEGKNVSNLEPLKQLATQFDFSRIDTSHTASNPTETTK